MTDAERVEELMAAGLTRERAEFMVRYERMVEEGGDVIALDENGNRIVQPTRSIFDDWPTPQN